MNLPFIVPAGNGPLNSNEEIEIEEVEIET